MLVLLIEATAVGPKHLLRILFILGSTAVWIRAILILLGLSSVISCQIGITRADVRTSRRLVHALLLFSCMIVLEFIVLVALVIANVLVAPWR